MCNITKLYNSAYIDNYLKANKFLIANICSGYNKETFDIFLSLYNKYKNKYLCDWFPRLWAIVIYKNKNEQSIFADMINAQIGPDMVLNSYTEKSKLDIQNNRVVITYNNAYRDYITFDQERDVG